MFSPSLGTPFRNSKKPREWGERIIALYDAGMNPHHISKVMGQPDPKSVYDFIRRLEISRGMTTEQRQARKLYRHEPGPRPCNTSRVRRGKNGDTAQGDV